MQHAVREQLHDFFEQTRGQVGQRAHQLIGIDTEIADVVAERPQPNPAVLIEVAFAEFEETAKRTQRIDTAHHRFTGQRVEHDIDTRALRALANFIGEGEAARIEHVIRAEQTHEFALLTAACGSKDFRTEMPRKLDRRDTDAARCAMHKHTLAATQTRQLAQRVIRSEERGRHGGRFFERETLGLQRNRFGSRAHMARERRGRKTQHRVAHGKALHIAADTRNAAGQLHADRRARKAVFNRFIGQQTHRIHHVAEIQAGGNRFDFHFVRGEFALRQAEPFEVAQRSRRCKTQYRRSVPREHRRCRRAAQGRVRRRQHTRHVTALRRQQDFFFAVRRE